MKQTQLTCVIPIGPNHLDSNNLFDSIRLDSGESDFILILDSTPINQKNELNEFAKQNQKISTIEVAVRSPGTARNSGILRCKTKWIVFFDSDDFFDTRIISRYLKEAEDSTDAIVFGFEIDNGVQKVEKRLSEDISGKVNHFNRKQIARSPGIWRWIFRHEAIKEMKFKDFRMGEDVVFLIEFLKEKRKIHFSAEVFYTYGTNNPTQLTRSNLAKQDLLLALDSCLQTFKKSKNLNDNLELRINLTSLIFYSCIIHSKLREKLKGIVRLTSFTLNSMQSVKITYNILVSRFRIIREE